MNMCGNNKKSWTLCMSVFTQVPAAVLTGRRENGVAHQRVFKSVDAGTFLRRPQRPRRFVCSPLTLPGHLQFPAFLRPLRLSGTPTVDREPPRAREAPSSDSCNELLKTHACISGISPEIVTHGDRRWALQAAHGASVVSFIFHSGCSFQSLLSLRVFCVKGWGWAYFMFFLWSKNLHGKTRTSNVLTVQICKYLTIQGKYQFSIIYLRKAQ